MTDTIELLSHDDDGNAIEGSKYPPYDVIRYLDNEDAPTRIAYMYKFFKRDENGRPVPETIVRFLVPDYLLDGANPSLRALRLVEVRMGWGRRLIDLEAERRKQGA